MYVEKKGKWKAFLIGFILFALALLGGGYYFLNVLNKKEAPKPKPVVEKEEKIPLTATQQEYILKKISFYDGMLPYNAFTAKTLVGDKALQFVESLKNTEYVDFTKGVRESKIDEIIKRYFGPDASLVPSSTCLDPNVCYFYDKEKKQYLKNTPTVVTQLKTKNIFLEGTQEEKTKKIEVHVKQLYYQKDAMAEYDTRFFKTAEEAIQNGTPLFDLYALYGNLIFNANDYPHYFEENYLQVKDGLPTITYTFAYQEGGYYLESVVK